MLVSKDLFE